MDNWPIDMLQTGAGAFGQQTIGDGTSSRVVTTGWEWLLLLQVPKPLLCTHMWLRVASSVVAPLCIHAESLKLSVEQMSPMHSLAKCPLANCLLAKRPLAKRPLARWALAKCPGFQITGLFLCVTGSPPLIFVLRLVWGHDQPIMTD